MRGWNDLVIDGKKVLGVVMMIVNGCIYGGYFFLLDVDFDVMEKVLNFNWKKIEFKGIKFVWSWVGDICSYLLEDYCYIIID